MLKKLLIVLLSFFAISGYSQEVLPVSIGQIDTLYSNILGEKRTMWVHIPESYKSEHGEAKSFPVLYLLDGDSHFSYTVGMVENLSSRGNSILPKMIVVGILNTDRTRDLTPTKSEEMPPFISKSTSERSGGGESFMQFIEDELIPHIESNYSTLPYRVFIGHSFGGLTVLNTLIENTTLFDGYIAIDPGLFYNNQRLLNAMEQSNFQKGFKHKSLFHAIANTMESNMDIKSVTKDISVNTLPIRSNLRLEKYLNELIDLDLKYSSKYYPNDTHGSVPVVSTYDGLRFIFSSYELKLGIKEYVEPESKIFDKIVNHYKRISNELGYKIKPEEQFIDIISYEFLSMKQYEKAEKFFILNTKNYAKSYNAFDSLGDFYRETGNKTKARENYLKSIELYNKSPSKMKLKELNHKK